VASPWGGASRDGGLWGGSGGAGPHGQVGGVRRGREGGPGLKKVAGLVTQRKSPLGVGRPRAPGPTRHRGRCGPPPGNRAGGRRWGPPSGPCARGRGGWHPGGPTPGGSRGCPRFGIRVRAPTSTARCHRGQGGWPPGTHRPCGARGCPPTRYHTHAVPRGGGAAGVVPAFPGRVGNSGAVRRGCGFTPPLPRPVIVRAGAGRGGLPMESGSALPLLSPPSGAGAGTPLPVRVGPGPWPG